MQSYLLLGYIFHVVAMFSNQPTHKQAAVEADVLPRGPRGGDGGVCLLVA